MKKSFFVLFAAFVVVGCSTQRQPYQYPDELVTIETLLPPALEVPINIEQVVLINACSNCDSTDTRIASQMLGSLAQNLQKGGRMKVVQQTNVTDKPVNLQIATDLANSANANGVIVVDNIQSLFVVDNRPVMAYGYPVNEVAVLDVRITSRWRLYNIPQAKLFDKFEFTYNNRYISQPSTDKPHLTLTPKDSIIMQSAAVTASIYGKRVSPFWVSRKRMYYTRGHARLQEAAVLAKNDKWTQATAIWKTLSDTTDAFVASRALYNMAVAAELSDNVTLAKEYAQKALTNYKLKTAQEYLSVLNKRQKQQSRLGVSYK